MTIDPGSTQCRIPFSSAHGLGKLLIALFLLAGGIDAIAAYSDLLQIDLISSMLKEYEQFFEFEPATIEGSSTFQNIAYETNGIEKDINRISIEESAVTYEEAAELNDNRQAIIGAFQLIWLPIFALFLFWFYKVYRNLAAFGVKDLSTSARMAAAYFLIPFICMYKPYTAAVDVWKGSEPGIELSTRAIRNMMKKPHLLKIWWLFWLASGIASFFAFQYASSITDETTPDTLVYLSWTFLIADTLSAVCAVLTTLVIRRIDKMQQEKSKWVITSDLISS